jgi:hypothetical protein
MPELDDVVPVPVELEFLLPLHAAMQAANTAIIIALFAFFIIRVLFKIYNCFRQNNCTIFLPYFAFNCSLLSIAFRMVLTISLLK